MRILIISVRSETKNSVLLEAVEPVLSIADEIIPNMDGLKEKQKLVADALQAYGTHVLGSRMNRLVSRTTEGVYYLMGKMFIEGIAVKANYEKSASFFQCAIDYGT